MKKVFNLILAVIFLLSASLFAYLPRSHAAFNPNLLIDDTVFSDTNSMNAAQIDNWLNTYFGSGSCISTSHGFSAPDPTGYSPSGGFTYSGNVSAGRVIADAAQAYGLNPQVLLATLQKEQSLVTGGGCTIVGDTGAMGYGCPDSGTTHSYPAEGALAAPLFYLNNSPINSVSGTCVNSAAKAGFSQQVIHGAWLLKFGQQRSLGNTGWNVQLNNSPQAGDHWDNSDDPPTCYGGPMTQGTYSRGPCSGPVFYDGYTTIDGSATHMDSGATAALYWYTPHFHGNQNFVSLFESWFGSTISAAYYQCRNPANVPGAPSGRHVVANRTAGGRFDSLSLVFMNNTGSGCIEIHTWGTDEQNWVSNTATNHPAVNPADDTVIAADTDGNGRDDFYLVKYRNTDSGKIEIHRWDDTKQRWESNIATNHPAVDPADDAVIAADTNGDGKDELILVKYRNTSSGKIEIHTWNPGYQSWYSNIATNHPAVDPADDAVIAANTSSDGGSNDKLILVKYRNTSSGKIEIHTWNPGYQSWYSNIATNHPAVNPADDGVIAGATPGDGKDKLMLVKYLNTGSGKIEVHTWGINEQSWYSNIATNHPTVN